MLHTDEPMCGRDRFYRFCEFGRELVYDTEGVTAFFVNDAESTLLDLLQEGNSIKESIAILQNVYECSIEETTEILEHLKNEGVLTDDLQIPSQHFSQSYTVTLNLTQECNLRCKYCYVKKSGLPSFMSERVAKKAVDFLLAFEGVEGIGITFYGGEPLLNFPVMKSTMEYAFVEAEKRGLPEVKYHITTNGTLLTDEIIAFLADYHVDVMVSIDGPASIHDGVRVTSTGEGTHATVLNQLRTLINTSGIYKVGVNGVVTNRGRLKTAYEYLSRFAVKDIKLSPVRYLEKSEYALTNAQKEQYKDDMRNIASECLELLLRGIRPPYHEFEDKILQLWNHTKRTSFCPAGMRRFGISPAGGIYPCGPAAAMEEWMLGTLEDGLDKKKVDRWTAVTSFEYYPYCRKCWARYLCAGGCPLRLVKRVDKQRCEISQHSTRLAIALYAAVKEKNEMMFAALVDEEFLSYIERMLQGVQS